MVHSQLDSRCVESSLSRLGENPTIWSLLPLHLVQFHGVPISLCIYLNCQLLNQIVSSYIFIM